MSADNGVYILKTRSAPLKEGAVTINRPGFEYRVAHCQAIDNLDHSDVYMAVYFGDSKVFYDYDEAAKEAFRIEREIGYTEYGIDDIDRGNKLFLNMTAETAMAALDYYSGSIPV